MYQLIQTKEVKCRKLHFCHVCDGSIAKGKFGIYRAYKIGKTFFSNHAHYWCDQEDINKTL